MNCAIDDEVSRRGRSFEVSPLSSVRSMHPRFMTNHHRLRFVNVYISKGFYNSRAIVYTESLSFVFFCFEDFGSFVSKAERGETLNVAGPEKGGALPTGNPIPPCFS